MITAEDARNILNDSMNWEHKSIWFKIRLWWICGNLNRQIQHAASIGETSITLYDYKQNSTFKSQYFPLIKKFYKRLGFYVGFKNTWETYPVISWKHKIDENENKTNTKTASNEKIDLDDINRWLNVTKYCSLIRSRNNDYNRGT